ncbi:jg20244 [Pararge aegeria aegeria]|uniref:Jg20244 protein n=1 Tax=Pararge aegeria aegeria TaxID=348720 RepID=A0A8S4R6S5_9NEOP|nr:jg20244 [Pararge aegeria aegeria]
MANPGTSRMDTDPDDMKERDNEIDKLMNILDIILNERGAENQLKLCNDMNKFIFDIDLSDEVSGFLMTVFTCLRKEENDKPGHLRFMEYTAKVGGVEMSVKSVVEKIRAQNIKINFLICTPIVEIITLFRSFYDEVRTGVTRFKVRDSVAKRGVKRTKDGKMTSITKKQESTQNISQYGLTNQHISLLQGVTLAPERRTGILRSIGPLTQAILLVMEDKFFDKLRSALSNSLQMLPMAAEIITAAPQSTPHARNHAINARK